MAQDGQRALIEAWEAKGFVVEVRDTVGLHGERYFCYLARGNLSEGYFGATEVAALRRAVRRTSVDWPYTSRG